MPYTERFYKLSFGGSLAGGEEIWTTSISLNDGYYGELPETSLAIAGALLPNYATEISNFMLDSRARIPRDAKLGWVKIALIGTDGKYMLAPMEIPTTGQGEDTGGYVPQAALVFTSVSDRWKDPGRYNRNYFPTAAPDGLDSYNLTVNQAQDAADAFAEFLVAIDDVSFEVASGTNRLTPFVISSAGAGSSQQITSVRVGRVLDTQRRRRNSLAEDYQSTTVPPPAP